MGKFLRTAPVSLSRVGLAVVLVLPFAATAWAQTMPLPAPQTERSPGWLTRAAWFLSMAPMKSGDPRFAWSARGRFDVDLATYPRGRVNFLYDDEIVLGRERREFDANHSNLIFETSSSLTFSSIEMSGVFHHTSRHVIDRPADRVVAWHTVAARAVRPFAIGRSLVTPDAEFHHVVQRTFVDYTWIGQYGLRFETAIGGESRAFASGHVYQVGVDRAVLDRGRQNGGRVEAGVHLPGRLAALDLYGAFERRVDAYPLDRAAGSWFEAGWRLAAR